MSNLNILSNTLSATGSITTPVLNPLETNVTMNGSLIIPDNRSISVYDATVDVIRTRSDVEEPILVMNDLQFFGTDKNIIGVDDVQLKTVSGHSGMGIAIQTDAFVNGTFGATGISTFNSNVIVDGGIYLTNPPKLSRTEAVREVVFDDTFNRFVTRPTSINYKKEIIDTFDYVTTNWVTVPAIGTIGDPVIDAVTGFLSYPSANDTIGTIMSAYPWRIRMNNTSSVYCYSMVQNGMYIFIPTAATSRNFFIHRPFNAYKGSDSESGFMFYARFAMANLVTTNSIFIGLCSSTGSVNTFALDGNNTLTTLVEAVGFLLDYSINSNYKLRLLVRKASTTTTYETGLTISAGTMYDLKIMFNNDYPTLTFAYGASAGILLTENPITDFSSNPSTSILYDPCVSVSRSSGDFGLVIGRMQMVHEEII